MIYNALLAVKSGRTHAQVLSLAHNEFEDNSDWLGLIQEEIEAQEFLTIDSHEEVTEFIRPDEATLKFPVSGQPAP